MKKNHGITLIALIITIIILLILAGVVLASLIGENGILKTSKKSKLTHEIASLIEEIKLELKEVQTTPKKSDNLKNALNTELKKNDTNSKIEEQPDGSNLIYYKKHTFIWNSTDIIHNPKCSCLGEQADNLESDGYIKSGMMMRYDGIKNTRNGHSDDTIIWEDLSGNNRDLKLYNASSMSKTLFWEKDGIVNAGSRNTGFKTDLIPELKDLTQITVEAVVYVSEIGGSNSSDIVQVASKPERPYIGADISVKKFFTSNMVQDETATGYLSGPFELNKPVYVALSVEKNKKTLYIDGKEYSSLDRTEGKFYIQDDNNMFVSMLNYYYGPDSTNSFIGKVFSTRIYNRGLSNTEINNNYETDKKRFNLNYIESKDFGYTTNGLFAHYNGICNTDYGHRNVNYWNDISGNNRNLHMNTDLSQTVYWEKDGLVQTEPSTMVLKTDIIPEIQTLKQFTSELVFRPDIGGSTNSRDIFTIIQSRNKPYSGFSYFMKDFIGVTLLHSYNAASGKNFNFELKKPISITYVSELYNNGSGSNRIYINGKECWNEKKTVEGFYIKESQSNFIGMFNFEPYNTDLDNSFAGKIYSSRVYNRALSPQEIESNYAIDKKLFAL